MEALARAIIAGYFLTVGYFVLGIAGLSIIPSDPGPARALIVIALASWGLTYVGEMMVAYNMGEAARLALWILVLLNVAGFYAAIRLVLSA